MMQLDNVHDVPLTTDDSTVSNLSLYVDRAQITRVFSFAVVPGQNRVIISKLPNVIDHQSLRIEGHGPATIQDVSSRKVNMEEEATTSDKLEELETQLYKTTAALQRAKKAVKTLDTYMDKLDAANLDISKLGEAMDIYNTTEEKWDDKIAELTELKTVLAEKVEAEKERLSGEGSGGLKQKKLRCVVVVNLVATEAAEVRLKLIYAVSHCSWVPSYDIRVDTQAENTPATLVYKAKIIQSTGEEWTDVPITLETAEPTFGVDEPWLHVWRLTHPGTDTSSGSGRGKGGLGLGKGGAKRHRRIEREEGDLEYMPSRSALVTSKGHLSATFRIPGLTSIPSSSTDSYTDTDDAEGHRKSVTIAQLSLEATMSWECVPKTDARVHLVAKIKNGSEFLLLPGQSNVYVDQSFIARSEVPDVSPQETFECRLGLDPSIRVTYHPLTKRVTSSGFYTKSITHNFSQHISIHNTKSIPISNFKLVDHIPVSEDPSITVTLVSPSLLPPVASTNGGGSASAGGSLSSASAASTLEEKRKTTKVQEGVVAQWHGADDTSVDPSALGKDGKIDWVCDIPPHAKINVALQWDVSTTSKERIVGLDL